jgi:hypothetical protein
MPINVYPNFTNPYPITCEFIPESRTVIAISNSFPVVVTTLVAHGYLQGNIIRIVLPPDFGMQEINNQFGEATIISPTQFALSIDTRQYSQFSIPVGTQQFAQCIPFAEINSAIYNATFNNL